MKTKISIFIAVIAFLLLGTTIALTQDPKAYFKKDGVTVFETAIAEIDSIVFKQVTPLSEEEVTEFFTNFENFVDSPVFQSYNTIDEMKSELENWLRQQPGLENIKTDGNVLMLTFKGGATTEIEFMEPIESGTEDFKLEYEPETVDAGYFTGFIQNAVAKEQSNTELQSITRAATATYKPDEYIFPVLWQPFPTDFSSYEDMVVEHVKATVLPKGAIKVIEGIKCDPF